MHRSSVLEVQDLVKRFSLQSSLTTLEQHSITVIDHLSFSLFEGEALGILGPNGAGKTTLIKMLLSILTPTSGTIRYFGKNFFTHRSTLLEKISFASSYLRLPARLTVRTNLDIYAQLYGISSSERVYLIERYLKFFGMWNMRDKETSILSSGQMTRVMLAKAFISRPKIVLLDEPTASLDPESALEARTFIKKEQEEHGIGLLFTSHSMEEVSQMCDRILVLKQGRIIANDTPRNLAFSIARTQVALTPVAPDVLTTYLDKEGYAYRTLEAMVIVEVDEHAIADFLTQLAAQGISYSQITIHSPTLNDYFLAIAKEPL
jgi:ABC-2 type transport system ATP-binding protein